MRPGDTGDEFPHAVAPLKQNALKAPLRRTRGREGRLRAENEQLRAKIEAQEARIAELEGLVEQLSWEAKRQAAPFAKGGRNPNPKKPGRKHTKGYAAPPCRQVPERVGRLGLLIHSTAGFVDPGLAGRRVQVPGSERAHSKPLSPGVLQEGS